MVPPGMASVHKAQTSDHFSPLPNGDGGGRGGRGLSVYKRAVASFVLIVRAQSAAGRQYRCSQCWVTLGLCAVPCNKSYHTLKNYKRSPRSCILLWQK